MQKFNGKMEIIICDDGSNDGSIELIKKYSRQYPKLIKYYIVDRDKTLKGSDVIASLRASNLVKIGLKIAKGEYNIAISGDDYFINEKILQKQYTFLKNNPKYIACYSNFKWLNSDGSCFETDHYNLSKPVFWAIFYSHLSSFMFHKKCKENLLNRISDDVGMIYSIILSGKIVNFGNTSFVYNCRKESITQSYRHLEGNVGEILLFQDILNYKKYLGTYSRFYISLNNIYLNRKELKNKYYKKYLYVSKKENNDVLNLVAEYDSNNFVKKAKLKLILFKCLVSHFIYRKIFNLNKLRAK